MNAKYCRAEEGNSEIMREDNIRGSSRSEWDCRGEDICTYTDETEGDSEGHHRCERAWRRRRSSGRPTTESAGQPRMLAHLGHGDAL